MAHLYEYIVRALVNIEPGLGCPLSPLRVDVLGINVCKVAIAGIRVSVSPVRALEFEALI